MAERETLKAYIDTKLAEGAALARHRTQDRDGKPLPFRSVYHTLQSDVERFLDRKNGAHRSIVLPGLRGVGKTTLLLQLYHHLTLDKHVPRERVLYFSVDELREYVGGRLSDAIAVYVEDVLSTSLARLEEPVFLLIDEAHYDKSWDRAVKIVYDQTDFVFSLVTGSSALSMEMSPDLARCAKKEVIFPLSFAEYLLLRYGVAVPEETPDAVRALLTIPSDDAALHAQQIYDEVTRRALSIETPLAREFDRFLSHGGFPSTLLTEEEETYTQIFSVVDRIVEHDVFALRSFNTKTRNCIKRIIYYLALQMPGGTSDVKLASYLQSNPRSVRGILDVLEKTHLVLSVKPYGGARKVAKPWKYYFMCPSINAAIRFTLGKYHLDEANVRGLFAETMVASSLFRMRETGTFTGVFYDSREGGADFLLENADATLLPLMVGAGKKRTGQVTQAMRHYKTADYGIVVGDTDTVSLTGHVLRVPLVLFSML